VQIKYCSTFDSTPKGNIGQSLDAAVDTLHAPGAIVCPALPVNGRTTYMGYHFVGSALLSESPLRHHPLNPMTDANLVRWLQFQTSRKVGLIPLFVIRKGDQAVRDWIRERLRQGEAYWVADALEQNDIVRLMHAVKDHGLWSGGSGITAAIPGLLFRTRSALSFKKRLATIDKRVLVIAGSCSPATLAQNEFSLSQGYQGIRVNGMDILKRRVSALLIAKQAMDGLKSGRNIIIHASSNKADVQRTQALGRWMGLLPEATGERISRFLAGACGIVVQSIPSLRLILSGGETSGAIIKKLGWKALEIGLPIDPGVPYCFPLNGPNYLLAMKSGNFGAKDFYLKAGKLY
jgi:uncharacterized protein YgbK (DUF1537 family)